MTAHILFDWEIKIIKEASDVLFCPQEGQSIGQSYSISKDSRRKQQEAHDFSHGRNASSCQQTKVY